MTEKNIEQQKQEEQIFRKMRKMLRNKDVTIKEQKYAILEGKPSTNPKRSIWLMNVMEKDKKDYSLWYVESKNVEKDDDDGKISMWPYDGHEDHEELIKELLEKFLEHAFDNEWGNDRCLNHPFLNPRNFIANRGSLLKLKIFSVFGHFVFKSFYQLLALGGN